LEIKLKQTLGILGKKVKFKNKPYNIQIQIASMKAMHPQFKVIKRGKNEVEFIGDLVILPELPIYTVSILYHGNIRPWVKVLNPQLVSDPPHFYKSTGTLCLYHPDNYKWKRENLIAKEMVEWTRGWIYFYEAWLQYDEWYGPVYQH